MTMFSTIILLIALDSFGNIPPFCYIAAIVGLVLECTISEIHRRDK